MRTGTTIRFEVPIDVTVTQYGHGTEYVQRFRLDTLHLPPGLRLSIMAAVVFASLSDQDHAVSDIVLIKA